MSYDYIYMPAHGDTLSCPKCGAGGGQTGYVRVRGIMTDKEYNDRRCNKCGHLWTVGDSLELPFTAHQPPAESKKAGESIKKPIAKACEEIKAGVPMKDGFVPESDEIPF